MIELAADSLRASGRLRMRVAGSSMLPAIRPGDLVSVRRCGPAQASIGDVVLFQRDGRLFAHRVVRLEAESLVTRGDAVATDDPPVRATEFLGIVESTQRGRGPALDCARHAWPQRLAAGVFRRSALAGRLFTRWNAAVTRGAG